MFKEYFEKQIQESKLTVEMIHEKLEYHKKMNGFTESQLTEIESFLQNKLQIGAVEVFYLIREHPDESSSSNRLTVKVMKIWSDELDSFDPGWTFNGYSPNNIPRFSH